LGDTHHRKGAVEIGEGGIVEAICSTIGMTYGA
jgi:hypothetical protein